MTRDRLDPHQIPEDAGAGQLTGYVAEGVARWIVARIALLAAALCAIVGIIPGASAGLRGAAIGAGCVGFLLVTLALLGGWSRRPLWVVLVVVTAVCGGLLAVVTTS